jgi:2-haloacid dehalogenase
MAIQETIANRGRRQILKTTAGALLATASVVDLLHGTGIAHAADITSTPGNVGSIKVLAFDFQGSCVNYYDPIAEMGQAINAKKGLSLDWSSLTKGWVNNLYKAVGEHQSNYVPAAQLYRLALDQLLEQQNLSGTFSNEERDEMMSVWDRMVPWPDTAEGLARLKRKFALTTLSNASMASVFQTVRRHALPFDQILTGELVQAYKPAPQVYNLVTAMLGYKLDEVLFCATHFADLKEAKKFGYKTAWWPRPNETGPGQVTDTSPKPFVDIYARDILDLAQKLGA